MPKPVPATIRTLALVATLIALLGALIEAERASPATFRPAGAMS